MSLRFARFSQTFLIPLLLLTVDVSCPFAWAQAPEVQFLFPSGGRAGTTVEVELVGKQTADVTELYFSRPGLKATSTGNGKMTISIPADAKPGDCDVWAVSPKGLSVPCRFVISSFPERVEQEPNESPSKAQTIELPAVTHGRITPGPDADWYKIRLATGDALTMECRSTSLGGKVWPTLTVLDPSGREIAHDALTRLEPRVHVQIKEAGDYLVRVEDRAYRQTAAPFYRLTMTTGPWLVTAFPSALERRKKQPVILYGYRLPGGQPVESSHDGLELLVVDVEAPALIQSAGGGWTMTHALLLESFEYRHPGVEGRVRFELLDRTPQMSNLLTTDDKPQQPLRVELPIDIVARFDTPRHVVDWFQFNAKVNQVYWLEGVAERLGRPCDLEILLYDKSNKLLETFGDIVVPKGDPTTVPIETRDPAGVWKAPADGEYRLAVRDLLNNASLPAERAYRLSIGPRLEDVRLVAMLDEGPSPHGFAVSAGKSVTVTLTAIRRGGHEGKIEVRAESLPAGLKITPMTIAAKETSGKLVIEAEKDAAPWVGPLRLVATSEINRKQRTIPVQMAVPLAGATPPTARLCDEFGVAILK